MIAQEAGALVSGSHDAFAASVDTADFGDVTEEVLTGRKHAVIRAICDTEV